MKTRENGNLSNINLVLVFHLNQNLDPYVKLATGACYRGLLNVLRKHREHKYVLHLSGSLIHGLRWYEPDILRSVGEGVDEGLFELLGSTYAQNIIYSTDDWSNRNQLEEHQRLLAEVFGYTPQGFWNPERCWRQDMTGLLSAWAYMYTMIEESALKRAGLKKPHGFWRTLHNDYSINIFNDDESFRHAVNIGIWTGDFSAAFAHINMIRSESIERPVLVYAEDAEATGLWGYKYRIDPRFAWRNLDRFLVELEAESGINVTCFDDIYAKRQPEDIGIIPDSQAGWMVASLKTPGAPYHEDGFSDWFDFNEKAPKLNYYRPLFVEAGERIDKLMAKTRARRNEGAPNEAAERLLSISRRVLAGHQFEFGCIGIGGVERYPWRPHSIYNVSCAAARAALDPPAGLRMEMTDINGDGIPEIVIYNSRWFMVISEQSASLLYWYDLCTGYELAGNELALGSWGKYVNDQGHGGRPYFAGAPDRTWPDLRKEGKVLDSAGDDWWFRKYVAPEYLEKLKPELAMPLLEDDFSYPLSPPLRVRVVVDDLEDIQWKSDLSKEEGVLIFSATREGLEITKKFRAALDHISCEYSFINSSNREVSRTWTITNSFVPDYLSIMDKGSDILVNKVEKPEDENKLISVTDNSFRNINVTCEYSPSPEAVRDEVHFFAKPVIVTYKLNLPPHAERKISLKLSC